MYEDLGCKLFYEIADYNSKIWENIQEKILNCPILVQKIAITCKLLAINIKTYTKYSTYDSMHL